MEKIDEIIYSDLFKRIHSRDVLRVLETTIPIQKGNRSSGELNESAKQETRAYLPKAAKPNNTQYEMEQIIDALLFVNSELSTEKIFCLFIIAKQNFINRINRKPAIFNFNSVEERTNTSETPTYLDYGRISFMHVDSPNSNESNVSRQSIQRRSSQSSQRHSISIEDTEASFNDKMEYLVDYILEVLLVVYPEKLRMVLELEQCPPMHKKLISAPRNVLFIETIMGNTVRLKSVEDIPEQVQYKRKCRKNDEPNVEEIKSVNGMLKTSNYSYLKKFSSRFIPDSTENSAHCAGNELPSSPLHCLRQVLDSTPAVFKAKLKETVVDFVRKNVESRARFYRTPSGRRFEKEPASNAGLLRTVVLKVDDEPEERNKLSSTNFSKIPKRSKRNFVEMNAYKRTKKRHYEIEQEFRTEIAQMRRRNKSN